MARIAYPYDPDNLDAPYPPLVQDLIELKLRGYHESVREAIKMVVALKNDGSKCSFLKKLKGSPLLELKPHSRGGQKGGVRIYLFQGPFIHNEESFLLCRAEWKQNNEASESILEDTAYILMAFKNGDPVFPKEEL